jgi:hypothetical protein
MPWKPAVCALLLLGGCLFDADYSSGTYRCTDGRCPAGRVCDADDRCVAMPAIDAPRDAAPDVMIDARMAALTCVDPGVIPSAGSTEMGTTVGGTSRISAMCGGFVMNGADHVYRILSSVGDQLLIGITGVRAYVITPCSVSPSTPVCLGNAFASEGNPISVPISVAGYYWIVVDHETPATTGPYVLTVTRQ